MTPGATFRGFRVETLGDDLLRRAGVIGLATCLTLCLTLVAFTLWFAISPWRYAAAMREDGPVEYLTAVAFLAAGLALFTVAWRRHVGFPRLVLAALGVVMVFVAGEEVSWGQRILGFATPDALSRNEQGEATLHNMPGMPRYVVVLGTGFILLPCVFGIAGVLAQRHALCGVPLPSLPLTLAGLATLGWRWLGSHGSRDTDLGLWLGWALDGSNVPFLLLAAYAVVARRIGLLLVVAATQACCAAFAYVHYSAVKSPEYPSAELREFLFGLFWLGYAAQVCGHGKGGNAGAAGDPRHAAVPRRAWPLTGLGLLALSVGMVAFERFGAHQVRTNHGRAMLAEARRLLEPHTPAMGTPFDVELHPGRVVYLKRQCSRTDLPFPAFFLHVFPEHPEDLPLDRSKRPEFAHRIFRFAWHGALVDGVCGAVVPLPDYPIASVRTGQFNREGAQLWAVRLP